MATLSCLGSSVPLGSLSVGSCVELLADSSLHSLHLPSLYVEDVSGSRPLQVAKLFLDLSLPFVSVCSKVGCLGSRLSLCFSIIVCVSLRMCGGAIPASLYNDVNGVGLSVPVMILPVWFNSGSTFLA